MPSPQVDSAAFWDGRCSKPGYAYGEQPNDFLREQAAELGHRVLAQDLSAVGLAKAKALARSRGVTIETSCGDLDASATSAARPGARSRWGCPAAWRRSDPGGLHAPAAGGLVDNWLCA